MLLVVEGVSCVVGLKFEMFVRKGWMFSVKPLAVGSSCRVRGFLVSYLRVRILNLLVCLVSKLAGWKSENLTNNSTG